MKNFKRRFDSGALIHCYQRAIDGNLIFYNVCDCLVLFTIICICAARHNVRVAALSFMPEHIHGGYIADARVDLTSFVGDYTSLYSRAFNREFNRSGPLFESPFGSAVKGTGKAVRTNLIYIYNNPVERHIVQKAEQYKWNFLAFAESNNPFSVPVVKRQASGKMKNAMALVEQMALKNR